MNRATFAVGLVLAALTVPPATAQCRAPEAGALATGSRQAETLLTAHRQAVGGVGVQAAVWVNGSVRWNWRSDSEVGRAFPVGSVSKALTAVVAGRMADDGRVDLGAPLSRYLAEAPGTDPTLRQLAGHLAGYPHYRGPDDARRLRAASLRESARLVAGTPPGEAGRFMYSSPGFILLGAALEVAGDAALEELARRYLAEPLELESLGAVDELSGILPAGGFEMSARELAAVGGAVLTDPSFLSNAARSELFTPQRDVRDEATGYGVGWMIGSDPEGRPYYRHDGNIEVGRAHWMLFPEQCTAVVVQLDRGEGVYFNEGEAWEVADLFLDAVADPGQLAADPRLVTPLLGLRPVELEGPSPIPGGWLWVESARDGGFRGRLLLSDGDRRHSAAIPFFRTAPDGSVRFPAVLSSHLVFEIPAGTHPTTGRWRWSALAPIPGMLGSLPPDRREAMVQQLAPHPLVLGTAMDGGARPVGDVAPNRPGAQPPPREDASRGAQGAGPLPDSIIGTYRFETEFAGGVSGRIEIQGVDGGQVVAEGRRPLPITAVRVDGDAIRIETAAGMTFVLRLNGDRFTGEVQAGGQSFPLRGERAG